MKRCSSLSAFGRVALPAPADEDGSRLEVDVLALERQELTFEHRRVERRGVERSPAWAGLPKHPRHFVRAEKSPVTGFSLPCDGRLGTRVREKPPGEAPRSRAD